VRSVGGFARYSSKPACSDFTSVGVALLCASVVSLRDEPVVVCGSGSFGCLRFSPAESALLCADDPARGEVTGDATFGRSFPDSTTTRVPTFTRL
jgi:hypothetical protein